MQITTSWFISYYFPPELQRHDLRRVRGGGGGGEGGVRKEREREKRRERDEVGVHSSVKKILSGVRVKNKKIAGITCLFQCHPTPPYPPLQSSTFLKILFGHHDHAQPSIYLSFAFHASWLWCWYFDAVRRRALSLFQFSKGSTGSALAHTDFFPTTFRCAPPFWLFSLPNV